jgi:hypothetical protein
MRRKKKTSSLMILPLLILLILFSHYNATAGETGVGVINVPPEYSYIEIKQESGLVIASLIISDYNSWNDIYSIHISIEYNEIENTQFIFKQYETRQSFNKINQFSEPSEETYLLIDSCSYSHSQETKSVSDRCLLNVEFVYYPLPCTQLNIITTDRGGLQAATHIEYTAEGSLRSEQSIIIPGIKEPIDLSHTTIDAFALSIAVTYIAYLFKRKKIRYNNMEKIKV